MISGYCSYHHVVVACILNRMQNNIFNLKELQKSPSSLEYLYWYLSMHIIFSQVLRYLSLRFLPLPHYSGSAWNSFCGVQNIENAHLK